MLVIQHKYIVSSFLGFCKLFMFLFIKRKNVALYATRRQNNNRRQKVMKAVHHEYIVSLFLIICKLFNFLFCKQKTPRLKRDVFFYDY